MTTAPVSDLAIVQGPLDWDEFTARYWDRRPVLIKALHPAPFELREVFAAAALAARPPGSYLMPPNAQFAVGRFQQSEPANWFPRAEDGTFDGYRQRLDAELAAFSKERRYALVVHAFHAFHAGQWERERAFFEPLWERTGLPLSGAITTLFHGSYEHTPVGVHKDRFATFLFALEGRKRMRFWRERPWTEPVTTVLDYRPHLAASFTAEPEPGDLLYWPADYYHVGESLDATAATSVNVGVPREAHRAVYDVDDLLLGKAPDAMVDPDAGLVRLPAATAPLSVPEPPTDGALPEALEQTLRVFQEYGDPDRMRDRVASVSLRNWSASGLCPAPPPEVPQPLDDGTAVRARARVLYEPADGALLCAANGHVLRTTLTRQQVEPLLRRLAEREPVLVGELTAGLPPAARPEARRLLEALESFRALTREALQP
ncbi:JmjC domain-containing protein [Kitasatospora sp. NBC_01302]|uniref:JmjC domain-containing protein n=1 Tax=Kitasatospora sp. NBC_01302 TaxID=2903575 RepID=UPI002E11F2C7|nr:cupin domain-containing protein [Kitasatospora sp. NBC_01302]